jgi:hypothetical protein
VEVVILPDGEKYKTLEVVSLVWDEALRRRLNRNCTFVALGGGVIGDMTGYAAASYQRGVNFIQVRSLRSRVWQDTNPTAYWTWKEIPLCPTARHSALGVPQECKIAIT